MIKRIKKAIESPEDVPPFLLRQIQFGLNTFYNRNLRGRSGVNVMEEDWDNLIVLDACRYDLYKKHIAGLPGQISRRISAGSSSVEWINNTFDDVEFFDTVYVSANPYVYLETSEQFHDTIHAWKTHWNDEYHTVLPSDMADLMKEAAEKYPNKRIIAHFMQPHRPFIGPNGQDLEDTQGNLGHRQKALGNEDYSWGDESVFDRLRSGKIDKQTVWEAYEENLHEVLPHVKKLLSDINGKTIIMADHGNGFGERPSWCFGRIYAHPSGVYTPQLVHVPWHVVQGDRRRITSDTPLNDTQEKADSSQLEQRLNALGYR